MKQFAPAAPHLSECVTYNSVDAMYRALPEMRTSLGVDFGVWWRDAAGYTHRVSWAEVTGTFYAVAMVTGRTYLLGVVKGRAEAERTLDGWADICGKPNSLAWVLERMPREVAR